MRTDEGLWLLTPDQALTLVDPGTGEVVREIASPIASPMQLTALGGGRLGIVSSTELAVISDADGQLQRQWPAQLLEMVLYDHGQLIAAFVDGGVAAYAIGPSTDPPSQPTQSPTSTPSGAEPGERPQPSDAHP